MAHISSSINITKIYQYKKDKCQGHSLIIFVPTSITQSKSSQWHWQGISWDWGHCYCEVVGGKNGTHCERRQKHKDQWSWAHTSVNSTNLWSISVDFAALLCTKTWHIPCAQNVTLISLVGFSVLPMTGYFWGHGANKGQLTPLLCPHLKIYLEVIAGLWACAPFNTELKSNHK